MQDKSIGKGITLESPDKAAGTYYSLHPLFPSDIGASSGHLL